MEDTLRAVTNDMEQVDDDGLNPCSNGRYSQSIDSQPTGISDSVLILVLMEDTLRVDKRIIIIEPDGVLILVLMEDTLRAKGQLGQAVSFKVLILVLMEDTLREKQKEITRY